MATTKLWPVTNNLKRVQRYALDEKKTFGDLESVISYANNPEKNEHQYYIRGINCYAKNAYKEFQEIKKKYGKTGGVLAYHGYMSFAVGEATPEEALQMATEFAKEMWGERFQVLVSVHLNTDCVHAHMVVNSVSFVDGKKIRDNEKNWNYFKHVADDVCRRYGKSVVYEGVREPTKRDRYVRDILTGGLNRCGSIQELEAWLSKRGCKCQFRDDLKYWTIIPKGWTKPYRIVNLSKAFPGEDYSKAAIYRRLQKQEKGFSKNPESRTANTSPKNIPREFQPRVLTRKNSYPKRQNVYKEVFWGLYKTTRLVSDVNRILSGRAYYYPMRRIKFMKYSPKAYNTYVKKNRELVKENEEIALRLKLISDNNLRTREEMAAFRKKQKEKLSQLFEEKKLLEARSSYEDVSKELAIINNSISTTYKAIECMDYYLSQEERQR